MIRMIKETFKYIREKLLTHFIGTGLSFWLAAVAGYIMACSLDSETKNEIMTALMQMFDSAGAVDAAGNISALGIFLNNLRACALISFWGLMPLLFIPFVSVMMNGFLVGAVLGITGGTVADALLSLAVMILPHGIFEISAMALCGAMGTSLCLLVSARLFGRRREESIRERLGMMGKIYVTYVVPALAIAAVIEGIVLPRIFG